ncbi:hypothetical protein [Cyclobacterium qasimii]|uniref:Uncharacterized protein n=1 Tax=Cyclobacterium qasimii TaxID=1350429 RepID=A0A512C827_9BACT|nr:hypothetical protein [Cyclobacterium qasimii]GEO20361.1 hypothetical protein CQA01_08950 [Cyclobacterium qasimii]
MHLYNYKRRDLRNGIHLLGAILLLTSIFVLLSPVFIETGGELQKTLWVGISAFIAGLLIINTYEGTLIDLNEKKIKEYFSFCGFKTGDWKKLPPVKAIKLVPIEQKTTNLPNGISPTFSTIKSSYEIILFFSPEYPTYTFSYTDKSVAKKKLKLLSEKLLADEIETFPSM